MTDQTTCPTTLDSGARAGQTCGRPAKANGYCGFHAARADATTPKTSAEAPHERSEEGRGTPETGSEPATALGAAAQDAVASAEPDTVGEVAGNEAAHEVPKTTARPTTPTAPKPGPLAVRMMSSRGAVRRVQALTTLGYTPRAIATATGLSDDSIWWLLMAAPAEIQDRTHIIVADAFKRLRVTPLTGAQADRARALAAADKWAGPYDWDDIDTDPSAPHPTARKAWNTVDLANAIAAAKLEQGEPAQPVTADELAAAQAEIARLTTDLQQALESLQLAEDTAAGHAGQISALVENNTELTREKTDFEERLGHALETAATQPASAPDDERIAAMHATIAELEGTILDLRQERDSIRDAANNAITDRDNQIAGLEQQLVAVQQPDHEYLAPVTHIDDPTTERSVEGTLVEATFGPALAADVSITIERTERGGIHVVFPQQLLAEVAE